MFTNDPICYLIKMSVWLYNLYLPICHATATKITRNEKCQRDHTISLPILWAIKYLTFRKTQAELAKLFLTALVVY